MKVTESFVGRHRIVIGHVMTALQQLPDASVNTVVTSPPYWQLRCYQTVPQTWGGSPDCDHVWEERRFYSERTAAGSSQEAFSVAGEANVARLKEGRWREDALCSRCGAWSGELGQEKTPQEFARNLCDVFREVRRVLRPDGTLWIVLGDSYARDRRKGQHKPGQNGKQEYIWKDGLKGRACGVDLGDFEECELRDDLSAEEIAYVLEELAKARRTSEQTQSGRE